MSLPTTTSNPAPASAAEPHAAQWFADHVQPHGSQLKAYLRGSFPSIRDVDDVVQESFLRVWKARGAHPIHSAKAFLFKVARHLALDLAQRERASPVEAVGNLAGLPVIEENADVVATVSAQEKIREVSAALVALPARCRAVVMLRKLKGLSRAEVAGALGIAEKTVDEQLARGLRRLEAELRRRGASRFES